MISRILLFTSALVILHPCLAQSLVEPIEAVLKVGPEAAHHREAAAAVTTLSQAPASELPRLLGAMNQANDLAANYLRSAVESVLDRSFASQKTLPLGEIRDFLLETRNAPRARRLAYEILQRVIPEDAARMLPGFANDPSAELRYDAVELQIRSAETFKSGGQSAEAVRAFQSALNSARNPKQIDQIAGELRSLGVEVDLPKHFGFLTHWQVIGPFDNTRLEGFERVDPPEKEIDLAAEYDGKSGKVRWTAVNTGQEHGKVDLNPVLGESKEVMAYATTVFQSPIEGPAEIRLGCKNGWKVWWNGKFLFGRDEYHRGARIDQYRLPIQLQKGANVLLLKVCQNADVKDWTREWEFQLRVCDSSGTAILATDRPPTPKAAPRSPGKSRSKKD